MACGSDDFCGGGVSRPDAEDTAVGSRFLDLLGKADTRTQQMFNLIKPIMDKAGFQIDDLLSGGTTGLFTPAAQAAVASGRSTLHRTLQNTGESLDRSGITGLDRVRLLTDTERAGEQQIAGIPTQFTQPVLNQIFAALTGTQDRAVQSQQSGLGAASSATSAAIQPIKGANLTAYAPQVAGCGPTGG